MLPDTIKLPTIRHPAFQYYSEMPNGTVVAAFKVGYYEDVPKAVKESMARIETAMRKLHQDLAMIREWNGNVVIYPPNYRQINPEVTEDMKANFILAATKATGWELDHSWVNSTHGVVGFSVRLRKPKEST